MVHHSKRGISKGALLTTVQHECYEEKTGLASERRKVRLGLRRIGWAEGGAEGGAGGIGATVVAKGSRTRGAAAASPVGPLEHARLEIRVAAGVLHQMVAAHETLVAEWAAKFLFPGVGAVVTCKLV